MALSVFVRALPHPFGNVMTEKIVKSFVSRPGQCGTNDVFSVVVEVSVSVDVGKEAAYAVEFKDVVSDPHKRILSKTPWTSFLRLIAEAHIKKQTRPSTSAISSWSITFLSMAS